MQAKNLGKQKGNFFKPTNNQIPTIGGKNAISKETIRRATGQKPTQNISASKPSFRKRLAIAAKIGLGALAVSTALRLVDTSMNRAKVDRLARASDLRAKTTLVEKSNLKYTNRYPQLSPADVSREMKEVSKKLKLNLNTEEDKKISDAIFEVARKSGVSPETALNTLKGSSGRASAYDKKIAAQRQRVKELEEIGEITIARKANHILQQMEKIQKIAEERDKLDPSIRSSMLRKIDSIGPFQSVN